MTQVYVFCYTIYAMIITIKIYFHDRLDCEYQAFELNDLSIQTITRIGCNVCNAKYGYKGWIAFDVYNSSPYIFVNNPELIKP